MFPDVWLELAGQDSAACLDLNSLSGFILSSIYLFIQQTSPEMSLVLQCCTETDPFQAGGVVSWGHCWTGQVVGLPEEVT